MDVTWTLRPEAKWHDGTPVTSGDVKFTVDAINDPAWNPESTDGFDRIASVDTPDDRTAIVHYREVYAPYALQFVRGMLPKHMLEGREHRPGDRLQSQSARHRSLSRWPSGRPASTSCSSACPTTGAGSDSRRSAKLLFKFLRQHQDAHQSAEERRGACRRARAVGQGPRARSADVAEDPPDDRQQLRARDAQSDGTFRPLRDVARPAGARARHRPRV